jgi:hypothetical protein
VPTGSLRRHEEEISCGQTVLRKQSAGVPQAGRVGNRQGGSYPRLVRSLWLLNYDRVKEKTVVETVSADLL